MLGKDELDLRSAASGALQRFQELAPNPIPRHIAIIPDGNRRWATKRSLQVHEGHLAGYEAAKRLAAFARSIGIHTVTIWGFSTENWKRDAPQVQALMALFESWIKELLPQALEEDVRFTHLGRLDGLPSDEEVVRAARSAGYSAGLPDSLRRAIVDATSATSHCTRNFFNLALNYGGVDEVNRAIEKLVAAGPHDAKRSVLNFLDNADHPYRDVDLVLRSSGEHRTSGLMPLQCAYSELVFLDKLFPDVVEDDLLNAVLEFARRRRNFGA